MFLRLSVLMEQFDFHGKDIYEIWYLSFSPKSAEEVLIKIWQE